MSLVANSIYVKIYKVYTDVNKLASVKPGLTKRRSVRKSHGIVTFKTTRVERILVGCLFKVLFYNVQGFVKEAYEYFFYTTLDTTFIS